MGIYTRVESGVTANVLEDSMHADANCTGVQVNRKDARVRAMLAMVTTDLRSDLSFRLKTQHGVRSVDRKPAVLERMHALRCTIQQCYEPKPNQW